MVRFFSYFSLGCCLVLFLSSFCSPSKDILSNLGFANSIHSSSFLKATLAREDNSKLCPMFLMSSSCPLKATLAREDNNILCPMYLMSSSCPLKATLAREDNSRFCLCLCSILFNATHNCILASPDHLPV